jgi:hypothetical protein
MTNESTEAVLQLCLQTQHENTKRAICRYAMTRISDLNELRQWASATELSKLMDWLDQLKLEDTK